MDYKSETAEAYNKYPDAFDALFEKHFWKTV